MIEIIITLIFFVTAIFSGSYHMNEEIKLENKVFKKVKLNDNIKKIFIFKDKRNVLIIALAGEILGYIVLIIGLLGMFLISLKPAYNREHLYRIYIEYLFVAAGSTLVYILGCVCIHKVSKYIIKNK